VYIEDMSNTEVLEAAKQTLTLMTASRLAAGMTADEAFQSALASFVKMCEEG
jgi:hypothetical protein